jgi:pilus assembly protein CpaC
MHRYDVTVERDLSSLSSHITRLFPGESIQVASNGKSVVVSGNVSSKFVAEKAVEVAAGHVEKKEDVVNLLQVREARPPQVLLRVRFAEVSRSALTELGASYFTSPNGKDGYIGRVTTQQFPAPVFESEGGGLGNKLIFSDFLNLFLWNTKEDLGLALRFLQNKGLFQSLAEPNVVAESGKEASFLAGGEIPIPVAQGGGANLAISIIFKEFGVRLNFTPTVTGENRVRLKVKPEVSTLDYANAITIEGFRIPALSTRRTETELELNNGQTFAIAGLLNNTMNESLQKIPGIGDIPILGYLFRSKAAQKNRTELVVMITPEILPDNSPGVTTETPRMQEQLLGPLPANKQIPMPGPAFTPQGDSPALVPRPQGSANAQPSVVPSRTAAEEAAAVMRARVPKGPTMVAPSTTPTAAASPASTVPANAAPESEAPAAPAVSLDSAAATAPQAAASAPEPEVRPLTKEEMKRLEKAREEERKAEERRRKEEEKAAKQAAKDAEKAMKEAEKAMKDAVEKGKKSSQ